MDKIVSPEIEALRYLIGEQKLEIKRLQAHIDQMSCCCSGCSKHNQELNVSASQMELAGEFFDVVGAPIT